MTIKNLQKQKIILKGTPASPGFAKGRVRIIFDPSECLKIEKGDILVTPMTNPEYMLAILRASAIITDFGGILCHAAIVSRELGKPCVIGTKKATRVLKDGQKIFVDANKGYIYFL